MKHIYLILAVTLSAVPVFADTVIAKRTIRAQEVITADDLKLIAPQTPGMAEKLSQVAGSEARRIIYAGRPIALDDIGPPALVERNEVVPLVFRTKGLTISTDGRALARGGAGDRIRVLNLHSRNAVNGVIDENGTVWVAQ